MPRCDTCGHDAQEIQAKLETRLAQQGERIKEMKSMLDTATVRATELDAKVKEYSQREEALSLREAETVAGWTFDERGRKLARWAYEDSTEGTAPEERPSFSEWLKSEAAAGDAVLGSYRQGATAVAPVQGALKPGTNGAAPRPTPTPPPNAGTQPPVRRTLDQINAEAKAVMSSGLAPAEKLAKLSELKAMRDQASPTGA